MSGKPAARQGDATAKGGPIIQGSAGVLIGAPSGVACSACPGGMAVGNPVNPLLGAKVLPGEVDFALPGPLSFVLSRHYSSYQTDTPAPVGLFGPGWRTTAEISLLVGTEELILNDQGGRSIHFECLAEGESVFSRSESLWLVRGGVDSLPEGHTLAKLWQVIPPRLRSSPHYYFAANSALGPWWAFGYGVPYVPDHTAVLPQPLPNRRFLRRLIDRFGRMQHYRYGLAAPFKDAVMEIVDGVGRRYRLSLIQAIEPRTVKGWGEDKGIRLSAVHLLHDPFFPKVTEKLLARYEYNEKGELVTVYDRTDQPIRRFTYHPRLRGRMISHQHQGFPVSRYRYDAQGRVVGQLNPEGLDYRFDYHADRTVVTDSLDRQQIYHFKGKKGLRRLVKLERADGSCIESRYDKSGRLKAQIDALGRKTEFELDVATGNILCVTAPDGKKTRLDYNGQGQVVQTTQPDGTRIKKRYDELGRLVENRNALAESTRYQYDDETSEMPGRIIDPNGATRTLKWTACDQLESYADCSDKQTRYRYNQWGRVTYIGQEEGLYTRYSYDPRGRMVLMENAQGEQTAYRYDDAGQLVVLTRADGSEEQLGYDAWGRISSRTVGGLCQQYRYDQAGRLIGLINENGAQTLFSYDVMDQQIQQVGFDGRTQQYRYNAGGELIETEDMGRISRWHYDSGGQLVARQYTFVNGEGGCEEQLQYNENGDLAQIQHRSEGYLVKVLLQRDKAGRLLQESQQVMTPEGELCWQYQVQQQYQQGLLEQTRYEGLPPVRWHTYGSGHLLGVAVGSEPLVEFERDSLHREKQRCFGDYRRQQQYDVVGRLERIAVNRQAQHPLSREYQYDLQGRITAMIGPQGQNRYRYDATGRLTVAQTPDFQQRYHYDPAGNRLSPPSEQIQSTPASWQQNNRIPEDEHYRYRYDSWGNLTEKIHKQSGHTQHYQYDHGQRLIHYRKTVSDGRLLQARYLYDPLGRRVGKELVHTDLQGKPLDTPQTTWYGWHGDNLVLTERDNKRRYTVYHPDSFVPLLRVEGGVSAPLQTLNEKLSQQAGVSFPKTVEQRLRQVEQELREQRLSEDNRIWLKEIKLSREQLERLLDPLPEQPETVHLYHCDHLGTPIALINQRGEVDWEAVLDPWGNVVKETNPRQLEQPIRMQGQHYDEESGLFYNRHRYYDPEQGRYISQDPIGLAGGMNFYRYPLNPIQRVDSLGLWDAWNDARSGACAGGFCEFLSFFIGKKKFENQDDAALHSLRNINNRSIKNNREYAGMICKDSKNRCFGTTPVEGSISGANPHQSPCPDGTTAVGDYHTHGNYSDRNGNPTTAANDVYDSLHFSPTDIQGITQDGVGNPDYVGYLGTPAKTYFKYTPATGAIDQL